MSERTYDALIFDFDGTLVDSDEALVLPLVALGARREDIVFGLPVSQGCDDLGVSMDDYVELYDTDAVHPYDGVADVVPRLGRWAL